MASLTSPYQWEMRLRSYYSVYIQWWLWVAQEERYSGPHMRYQAARLEENLLRRIQVSAKCRITLRRRPTLATADNGFADHFCTTLAQTVHPFAGTFPQPRPSSSPDSNICDERFFLALRTCHSFGENYAGLVLFVVVTGELRIKTYPC